MSGRATARTYVLLTTYGAATIKGALGPTFADLLAASGATAVLKVAHGSATESLLSARGLGDRFFACRMPSFDVRLILGPASSNNDGVDDIVETLESIASRAASDNDSGWDETRQKQRRRDDDERVSRHERLWIPRKRTLCSPAGLRREAWRAQEQMDPVRLFCGNARPDEHHKDALLKHLFSLRRNRIIETWDERDLAAGDERDAVIRRNLELAQLIVLLISADYLSAEILDRVEEQSACVTVVPILVRPVLIEDTFIGDLPCLPSNGQPITTWKNADEAWADVVRGIRAVAESIRRARARDAGSIIP